MAHPDGVGVLPALRVDGALGLADIDAEVSSLGGSQSSPDISHAAFNGEDVELVPRTPSFTKRVWDKGRSWCRDGGVMDSTRQENEFGMVARRQASITERLIRGAYAMATWSRAMKRAREAAGLKRPPAAEPRQRSGLRLNSETGARLSSSGLRSQRSTLSALRNTIVSKTKKSLLARSLTHLSASGPGGIDRLISKHRLEAGSSIKSSIKRKPYEPPDLNKAIAHMHSFRAHTHARRIRIARFSAGGTMRGWEDGEVDGPQPVLGRGSETKLKQLSLRMGEDEMTTMFSGGVCFWFIVLRDFLFTFSAFTLVSCVFFSFAAYANREAHTSNERLGGLARGSLGAILLWAEGKYKADTITDSDKSRVLGLVCLDTALMFVLLAVTWFHYRRKDAVKEKVDVQTVTVDDYSIKVTELPLDVTRDRIRRHFERLCGPVHEVTFGRDVGDQIVMRQRLLALEGKHDWLEWQVVRAKKILGEEGMDEDFEVVVDSQEDANRSFASTVNGSRQTSEASIADWSKLEGSFDLGQGNSTIITVHTNRMNDLDASSGAMPVSANSSWMAPPPPPPVSGVKARWMKAVDDVKVHNRPEFDVWKVMFAGARDKSKSMEERAEEAACAAQRADNLARTQQSKQRRLAGSVAQYRAEDYNLDILRDKLRKSLQRRMETADAIAACAQKGYRIVNAWITFSEEQHCVDCIVAVGESKKQFREARNGGSRLTARNGGSRTHERSDVCSFEGRCRINIAQAQAAPSDVLWENLSYSKSTMWKRQLRSVLMTVLLTILNAAIISAARSQIRRLPPRALCEDIGAGGRNLDCPAIWNLDNSSSVAGMDTPRVDIFPFVEQDATSHSCRRFMKDGKFVGNMTAYRGFYTNGNASAVAAFRASMAGAGAGVGLPPWGGGFDSSSEVDECAAHACYGCYCSAMGSRAYNANTDGLGAFCDEYFTNEVLRDVIAAGGVVVSSAMNIVIKEANQLMSQMERSHSLTAQEVSFSCKMMLALIINTMMLPLFLGADIGELAKVPFLFQGEYSEVSSEWYNEFGNRFIQIALINAIAFPLSCLGKVGKWRLMIWFYSSRVRTQQQLNDLYRPPRFFLSERYGPFLAAIVYSVIFSSGMPVLYATLVLWCGVQMIVDRLSLLRYCATPPRYTGKLAAVLIHTVPVAVILHFCIAVYVFGQRTLPSYTLVDGTSGNWISAEFVVGNKTQEVVQGDGQWDVGQRMARVNGLVPALALMSTGACLLATYVWLAYTRRSKLDEEMRAEGCPPLHEAIRTGRLTGSASYSITANPEYKHLFPPGDDVSEGL